MEKSVRVTVGPGTLGLLGITFTILKVLGYIDWSWWLVLLPFWGPLALVLTIYGVGFLFFIWADTRKRKK